MGDVLYLKGKIFGLLLSIIFSLVLYPLVVHSEVFNVTNEDELRAALSVAESNGEDDTIKIAAGIYRTFGEPFTFETDEDFSLTIEGEGAGRTILDGENQTRVLSVDSAATIKGLTIQNGFVDIGNGAGLEISGGLIEDCEFINNNGGGLYSDVGVSIVSTKFIDNNDGAIHIETGGGPIVIINNIFDSNNGGAVFISQTLIDITITNNTFVFNTTDGSGGAISMQYLQLPCAGEKNVCLSEVNKGNNIDEDPLFVDVDTGDVNLQPDSPCIDVGDPNAPGLPSGDIFGNPRGPIPDMGAIEFGPVTAADKLDYQLNTEQIDSQSGFNIFNNIFYGNSAAVKGDDIFILDEVLENCGFKFQINVFNNDVSDFYSVCENTVVENGGGNGGCSLTNTPAASSLAVLLVIPVLILIRRIAKRKIT